jgi:hypothetical protein
MLLQRRNQILAGLGALDLVCSQQLYAARLSACRVAGQSPIPWIKGESAREKHASNAVLKTLTKIHDDISHSLDSYAGKNGAPFASYVFMSRVLQNSHPGYRFWTRVYFSCTESGSCQSYDFNSSRTINFPKSLSVYRTDGKTVLVVSGLDQRSVAPAVELYRVASTGLIKC